MKLDNFKNSYINIWEIVMWSLLYGYFFNAIAYKFIILLVGYKIGALCVDIIIYIAHIYDSRHLKK